MGFGSFLSTAVANTWTAIQTFAANQTLFTGSNAGIELGSTSAANTPYIDFHSSGNNVDYDTRLLASAGTATAGQGTLTVYHGGVTTIFGQGGGVLLNTPTGGDKGAGTINVTGGYYVNGAKLGVYKLLGKGTLTTNQTITATTSPGTDITNLSVTTTPDGVNAVKITVSLPDVATNHTSGSVNIFVALQKDGTIINTWKSAALGFPQWAPVAFTHIDAAPTAASHTYKLSLWSSGGTGMSVTVNQDALTLQACLIVEQVGS
jgi:hypothetical protein